MLYIGSSIGNFSPADAIEVLRGVRAQLAPGDCLLLGADMVKDTDMLLAAYDDAAGVTAKFNKNLLVRINRELDGNFNPQFFRHQARWNEAALADRDAPGESAAAAGVGSRAGYGGAFLTGRDDPHREQL